MKNEIVGTYWLCKNDDGSLWLTQGNKPTYNGSGFSYNHNNGSEMDWLRLYDENGNKAQDFSYKDYKKVESSYYHDLKFPEVK